MQSRMGRGGKGEGGEEEGRKGGEEEGEKGVLEMWLMLKCPLQSHNRS